MVHKENTEKKESKLVKTLLEIIKNQFTKKVEPEIEVPRHRWVTIDEIAAYMGARVEVHAYDRQIGQSSVVGQLRKIEYTSADGQMRLTIAGHHFVATADLFGNEGIMVHL